MKKILSLFFMLFFVAKINASVVELTSGDLSLLRGAGVVNIQYDYTGLTVSGYPTLDDFVAFKKKKFEEKNPGKTGDEWYKNWIYNRENIMIPRFEDVLNKKLAKAKLSVAQNTTTAKYTLVVKMTHYIEAQAGFPMYIGIPTMFEAKVFLVETAKPDVILATVRADYLKEIGDLGGSIGNLIATYAK